MPWLSLIQMMIDSEYRDQQLKTDKRSIFLIVVGLPIGVLTLILITLGLTNFFST